MVGAGLPVQDFRGGGGRGGKTQPAEGARATYPAAPGRRRRGAGRAAGNLRAAGAWSPGVGPVGGTAELDRPQRWEGRGVWGPEGLDGVAATARASSDGPPQKKGRGERVGLGAAEARGRPPAPTTPPGSKPGPFPDSGSRVPGYRCVRAGGSEVAMLVAGQEAFPRAGG